MRLENPASGEDVRRILVQLPRLATIHTIAIEPGFTRSACDDAHRICWFDASTPLRPGQSVTMRFTGAYEQQGFQNMRVETNLLPNGTFLYAWDLVPAIGYDPFGTSELSDESARRRLKLPTRPRLAPVTDQRASRVNPLSADADWIEFEAHISTSGTQSVVTAGECTRRWSEAGRNHFQFRAAAPILRYFAVHSAEYTVSRDRWEDIDLEIYHHPRHGKNAALMMAAMKDALAYCVPRLGPYPHRHLRIVEFPRYSVYAEGFPGWIPISEGFLFIARPERDRVDELYRVVAHEVAHQWWGHQVIGSNTEGVFLLAEVLAQHGALKVVQGRYPAALVNEYAAAERDRYLGGRGRETLEETPLVRTNGETWYLNYAKGFLVMRALDAYLGSERLAEALGRFASRFRFQGPPYPTALDLVAVLREVTPAELQYLLVDQLETITFHDIAVTGGAWRRTGPGRFAVDVAYKVSKVRASGSGAESSAAVDDLLLLRVWDKEGHVVHEGWHRVAQSEGRLSVTTSREPARAALDPDRLLISRKATVTPGVLVKQ
jgi:hypothetical protein